MTANGIYFYRTGLALDLRQPSMPLKKKVKAHKSYLLSLALSLVMPLVKYKPLSCVTN